jgi:hypothetical protein
MGYQASLFNKPSGEAWKRERGEEKLKVES